MNAPLRPDVLLTMADYRGTLAAARSLGSAGVRVTVADGNRAGVAHWSRHVASAIACPDAGEEPERFVDWLLAFGARQPGMVLYPTSDDMCWLFARHRDVLARDFRLWVPDVGVVYTLLNKWSLYAACRRLEIAAPATSSPRSAADVERLAREASFPVVVKPQTQALQYPHAKGRFVGSAADLAAEYATFRDATSYARVLRDYDPDVTAPLVQAFVGHEAEGIYNLSGFVDETGAFVAEASRKVLQWPPRLGVGLCFEEAEVLPRLAADVARLCADVGYFGAFEVEFIEAGGRHLLIDFNPRFYGQMAFDVARGLDLPWLVYLASTGDRDGLAAALDEMRTRTRARGNRAYCDRVELEIAQGLLTLAGRSDRADGRRLRRWLADHRDGLVDAVLDRRDWLPGLVEAIGGLWRRARHPRSEWRSARRG